MSGPVTKQSSPVNNISKSVTISVNGFSVGVGDGVGKSVAGIGVFVGGTEVGVGDAGSDSEAQPVKNVKTRTRIVSFDIFFRLNIIPPQDESMMTMLSAIWIDGIN
jgi:hypothetical protein